MQLIDTYLSVTYFSEGMTKFLDLSTVCEKQSFSMASLYAKLLLLKGFVCKVAQI